MRINHKRDCGVVVKAFDCCSKNQGQIPGTGKITNLNKISGVESEFQCLATYRQEAKTKELYCNYRGNQ